MLVNLLKISCSFILPPNKYHHLPPVHPDRSTHPVTPPLYRHIRQFVLFRHFDSENVQLIRSSLTVVNSEIEIFLNNIDNKFIIVSNVSSLKVRRR